MSTGRRNLLEPIKAALGPERAMVFMEIMNALDLSPEDPELVLTAALASFFVSLTEFRTWAAAERAAMAEMLAKFVGSVDLKVAEAFTRGADEFQTELRLAAREIAHSEYRAAAALRSQAITDEVAALIAAAGDLARRQAELKAERTVLAVPPRSGGFFSPAGFALVAAAFVVGWAVALFMLRPGPRHAELLRPGSWAVAVSSIRSVNAGRPFSRTV